MTGKDIGVSGQIVSQSLLPHLDPKRVIHLHISLRSDDPATLGQTQSPFCILNDTNPLTRLIEGKFVTDAGSELKRVFLLVQSDDYRFPKGTSWPLTNPDIDAFWQHAFSLRLDERQDFEFILFSDFLSGDRRLLPFKSLFFCKEKSVFFHPPCPQCGGLLELCDRDDLLKDAKLPLYTSSLKRFLFCPSCHGREHPDFYVYERDHEDPTMLHDRWDLLQGFGKLSKDGLPPESLPCSTCADRGNCFGAGREVVSRIIPFSFYPFYLLIFEAMSLHAFDFLPLISGAAFEQLKEQEGALQGTGRLACVKALEEQARSRSPFFFEQGERAFFEVLYLKLCFLTQLFQKALSASPAKRHPFLQPAMDQVWVHLDPSDGLLPFFWNFRARPMDLASALSADSFPMVAPESFYLYSLAFLYFQTFLANERQGVEKLSRKLGSLLNRHMSDKTSSVEMLFKEEPDPFLLPQNIFSGSTAMTGNIFTFIFPFYYWYF